MATIAVTVRAITASNQHNLKQLIDAGHEIRLVPCLPTIPKAELAKNLAGAYAVIAGSEPYTGEVFDLVPGLRHVARFGVGFDAIDTKAATARGIAVSITPGSNASAVADLAFGLLLGIARSIPNDDRAVRSGTWSASMGADVFGATLGIIGLGRIGQRMARRGRGFDMKLIAYEPFPDRAFVEEFGIELMEMDEVFARADFITLHAPSDEKTRHLVDAQRLAKMKKTAYLINCARGGLVDEDALFDALKNKRIAGAGLDVRKVEPTVSDRFAELNNVILTPHSAASTFGAMIKAAEMSAESILASLAGEKPVGLINTDGWQAFLDARSVHA